jgi:hypothetical protein
MPNYYDQMLAALLHQGMYPRGTSERKKVDGEWQDVAIDPEFKEGTFRYGQERAKAKGLASRAEDAMLREQMSGRHPWRGGRYDFVPGTSRASTAGIDRHITGKWDRTPRADLMYMHPYSPEKWDDYGP